MAYFNRGEPVNIVNCIYKCYLIGSMESPGKDDAGVGWRQTLTPCLNERGVFCFDPTKEECQKVGMTTNELMNKLNGWQLSGNWEKFTEYMDMIWKGVSRIEEDPETKELRTIHIMGDVNYVENSDFLIWHLHENDRLGGTIAELVLAWTKGIPVYLVTSMPKSKINKSLLYFLLDSGHKQGQAFKSFDDLLIFLDHKYIQEDV